MSAKVKFMTTVYDVTPKEFISAIKEELKKDDNIKPPEWASFVKTGTHKEKAPIQEDWWFTRAASVLRKVYVNGPIGIERLSAEYGGAKDRGSKPNKAVKGSRSIIRHIFTQLQNAGLLEAKRGKGRVITSKGQSFLDNTARDVMLKLAEEDERLKKYF